MTYIYRCITNLPKRDNANFKTKFAWANFRG